MGRLPPPAHAGGFKLRTYEKFITVSPIYSIEEYVEELTQKKVGQSKIKERPDQIKGRKKMLDKFYLGTLQLVRGAMSKECFLDLKKINTVYKNWFTPEKRIASLSHWGRQVLNYQLMWVYGRPIVDWKIPPQD